MRERGERKARARPAGDEPCKETSADLQLLD